MHANFTWPRLIAAAAILLLSAVVIAAPRLRIAPSAYQVVDISQVDATRKVFDITLRAGIVNPGEPATNVIATLMSLRL